MVFWSRIRHLKFEGLSHQCKRWYFQIPGVSSTYYIAGRTTIKGFEKPNSFTWRRPTDLYSAVRSFAAPVQAKQKPEPKGSSGPRLNNQITADFVRLVWDEGHAVVSRHEALERARKLNLDLVEVQRTAKPPVCKIMDFHREQYKQQVKDKDRAKGKSQVRKGVCKEVRFNVKIEQKDLQMKADMVKRLMEKGYRVKCMAMGTEDQDLGGMLSRLSALIEDVSVVESGPMVERRQAYVIVRHIKFGLPKNGPAKKVSKVAEPTKDIQFTSSTTIDTSSHIQSPQQIEENWEPTESDLELEDETIPDQAESPFATSMKRTDGKVEESKMGWSSFDASGDDFEKVFDFDDNDTGTTKSSTGGRMDSAAGSPYPQQELHSVQAKSVPSPIVKPSFEGGNRYSSRIETRAGDLPTKSSTQRVPADPKLFTELPKFSSSVQQNQDFNRRPPGPMDSGRVVGSQFSNQHKPPSTSTTRDSPSLEQKQQLGNGASTFRPLKQPPPPVVDETQKQGQFRQGSPTSPSPSPTPSYGIFSAPKPMNPPNKQNSATEVTGEVNSPKQKAENGQRPEADKTRPGGWGIFSRDTTSSAK